MLYTFVMAEGTRRNVSRILLIVLLLTFLSPHLGWQMTAGHDEFEQLLTLHDQHQDDEENHSAHGFLGHLLTHMPMSVSATMCAPLVCGCTVQLPDCMFSFSSGIPEPPFRPPRLLS